MRPRSRRERLHQDSVSIGPLSACQPSLSLADAFPAHACPPQLAQYGGGMLVGGATWTTATNFIVTDSTRFSKFRPPPPPPEMGKRQQQSKQLRPSAAW